MTFTPDRCNLRVLVSVLGVVAAAAAGLLILGVLAPAAFGGRIALRSPLAAARLVAALAGPGLPAAELAAAFATALKPSAARRILRSLALVAAACSAPVLLMCHNVHPFGLAAV